jgi:hydrogenase nickel incorporation protein HypA/HybF
MHEMSIAESLVSILEDEAVKQQYQKVKQVWLVVGPLSAIEPEALVFCFEAVTKNTLAEGAKLHIEATPGEAFCLMCLDTVPVTQRFDQCPKCGSYQLQVTQGDDLRIKELEVE